MCASRFFSGKTGSWVSLLFLFRGSDIHVRHNSTQKQFHAIPVIPNGAARFFLAGRIMARRAAEWRDPSCSSVRARLQSCRKSPPQKIIQTPSSRSRNLCGRGIPLPLPNGRLFPGNAILPNGLRLSRVHGSPFAPSGAQPPAPQSKNVGALTSCFFHASVAKKAVKNDFRMCCNGTVFKQSGIIQMERPTQASKTWVPHPLRLNFKGCGC